MRANTLVLSRCRDDAGLALASVLLRFRRMHAVYAKRIRGMMAIVAQFWFVLETKVPTLDLVLGA